MTAWFRCLVTGSRDWLDEGVVYAALDAMWTGAIGGDYAGLIVVHGAAKGADRMAYRWYRSRARQGWAVAQEPHAADWAKHGRRAGIVRNQAMVRLGADVTLAFIAPCADPKCKRAKPHGSHRTTHCADLAERSGIHVERFRPIRAVVPVGLPSTPSPTKSKE
mgnify:CR=1 FL=1